MSQENIDRLRRIDAEWSEGNWQPRFAVYSPDMEWGWSEEFPGLAGVDRDPEARSERLRQWLSEWDSGDVRPSALWRRMTLWWQ